MRSDIETDLSGSLPVWNALDELDRRLLVEHAHALHFSAGAHVHGIGDECIGVLLVKTGSLRAYMLSPKSGKEITLFRVASPDTCVLSAACILRMITFDIFVDAVEDADVLAIDSETYLRLMEHSSEVEAYTYRQAAERFSDVMWIMHQIVFMSFDERLAVFLLDETARSGSQALHMTHDEIARHMGSAREVVSRMLKYFQQEGLVDLSRGCITLLDRQRLHTIAS